VSDLEAASSTWEAGSAGMLVESLGLRHICMSSLPVSDSCQISHNNKCYTLRLDAKPTLTALHSNGMHASGC